MNNKVKREACELLKRLGSRRIAAECIRLCGDAETADAFELKTRAAFLALADLHPDDRYLLTEFYIKRSEGFMVRLCEYFGCTPSSVYRRKRRAVKEFVSRMFGCEE